MRIIRRNKNSTNKDDLVGRGGINFRDIRSFAIIVFVVSLMTAATINTQAGLKQITHVLTFVGYGYLIVGMSQPLRMRR